MSLAAGPDCAWERYADSIAYNARLSLKINILVLPSLENKDAVEPSSER